MQGLGLFFLRFVVGLVSIAHGLQKLLPLWGGSPREIVEIFDAAGLTPAFALTVVIGIVEVFGGFLLVLGSYTFLTGLLLVVTNTAVAWKLHTINGLFIACLFEVGFGHGYEFMVLLIMAIMCLMLAGPGAISVDQHRNRVRSMLEKSKRS